MATVLSAIRRRASLLHSRGVRKHDRVPVSEDERIVVDIGKTTTSGYQPGKNRPGVFLWKLTLGAHEKRDVRLAHRVRFPKDVAVPGLE